MPATATVATTSEPVTGPAREGPLVTPVERVSPAVQAKFADLSRLGDEIVILSAQIQAATYHLLVKLREFDERSGWQGFLSCAHWLNYMTGLNLGAAREKVRVARALGDLPVISDQMRRGKLSYSKVRALTRVATPENEEGLIEFAEAGTASQVERLVRAWRHCDRAEEAALDKVRRESHGLSTYFDSDGMLVIKGRLDPETGAVVRRALEAARDRMLAEALNTRDRSENPPFEFTNADALGLIAKSALNADLDPGTRGDRYQVTIHVDAPVLPALRDDAPSPPGMAFFEDGAGISAETSRRLTCDAATITMTEGQDGNILDVGRRTRTVPTALSRALRHRDPVCQWPGCSVRSCENHHIKHWADGGRTDLDNLARLCHFHHRLLHEENYRMERQEDGQTRVFHPNGWEIKPHPPQPANEPVLWDLQALASSDGVEFDATAGRANGYCPRVDYQVALDHLRHPLPAHQRAAKARRAEAQQAESDGPAELAPKDGDARLTIAPLCTGTETSDDVSAETSNDSPDEPPSETHEPADAASPMDRPPDEDTVNGEPIGYDDDVSAETSDPPPDQPYRHPYWWLEHSQDEALKELIYDLADQGIIDLSDGNT